ncbi:hypothetical protein [Streptosporangium sp. NPDC002607]
MENYVFEGQMRGLRDGLQGIAAGISKVAEMREDLTDVSNALADVRTEVAEVAAAVRELADAIRTQQPRRFWQGRRAATVTPVPDPGDSCRCVWQGGTRVETCPGHTTDAWLSRLNARLNEGGA